LLIVDASIAVQMALHGQRPARLAEEDLAAPPQLWSEATSALHELAFRGEIEPDAAVIAIEAIAGLGISRHDPPQLYLEASRVARRLGWAKTYDAEYVALAMLSRASLLTRDARLRRGASRLITAIGPADL